MTSRQRLSVSLGQRLHLNPAMALSLRMLELDAAGLAALLEEQARANPALVLAPPRPAPGEWIPRWHLAFARQARGHGQLIDATAAASPSLIAHVLAGVGAMTLTAGERRIALALVEGLEPSGWLGTPLTAIARQTQAPLTQVEAVMHRLQRIEPAGLFARSLAECLRLQAIAEQVLDPVMDRMLAHLDLVAEGRFARLALICETDQPTVAARLRVIRQLDPKPGTRFEAGAAVVREPDLVAARGAAGWEVSLNRSALPTLLLRPGAEGAATAEERAAHGRAVALRRMVAQRNDTLLRVGREILLRQTAALQDGPTAMVPMTMAGIGAALDLHESTISRIVAGASVDTPRGTWWLRTLFTGQVGEGVPVAAAALRAALSDLVAAENPADPLSDAALAELLASGGTVVARRTVAKYRRLLRIPPGHRRRRRAAAG